MIYRKKKIKKSDVSLWLTIILLGIYIYLRLNFLTTFSDWWIALSYCCAFFIILLIFFSCHKSTRYLDALKISTIAFLCVWNTIYLYGLYNINTRKTINVIVPLNGYYKGRVDGVLFTYKGYTFNRTLTIKDVLSKNDENLPDKYELKLSLCEVLTNLYYINYIEVAEKAPPLSHRGGKLTPAISRE